MMPQHNTNKNTATVASVSVAGGARKKAESVMRTVREQVLGGKQALAPFRDEK